MLLAGEYAILEQGGLGLACAVEPHVKVTWCSGNHLTLIALYQDKRERWSPQAKTPDSLLDHIWDVLSPELQTACQSLKVSITLDSTNLSRPDQRKSGLGSSAAVTVGTIAALTYLVTHQPPDTQTLFQTALRAHRNYQQGQGSGYDVACSTFGGAGLFHGGQSPTWMPQSWPQGLAVKLISAPNPISTKQAIATWTSWKQEHPSLWQHHFAQSQHLVQSLCQAQDLETIQTLFKHAAIHGQNLGQAIGVWNQDNHVFMKPYQICKALGAGNELLAQLCDAQDPERISLSQKGIQWS